MNFKIYNTLTKEKELFLKHDNPKTRSGIWKYKTWKSQPPESEEHKGHVEKAKYHYPVKMSTSTLF